MKYNDLRLTEIDIRHASEREYAALNRHEAAMRRERMPADPAPTLEETVTNLKSVPSFVELWNWALWNDADEIVAAVGCGLTREQTNQHILFGGIEVLPAYRRQGLARRLLVQLVDTAERNQRRLLLGETYSTAPAGEAFMQRLGASLGMSDHFNQLLVAELDRELLRRWITQAESRATDFELGFWEGAYPDAELEPFSELFNVMNTAPRGTLEMEDWQTTPERLRQQDEALAAREAKRLTFYVRHKPTGELAGFTETIWSRHRPDVLEQWGTGVWPKFRNQGLGRWLKAAMLERVLSARPEVKFVRTGNATTNAPMLKINHALGFKPYMSHHNWQIDVEKLRAYLRQPSMMQTNG